MSSKRISMSLFDDELKSLVNASAKIFPMSETDITNNLNPNNYEYAKVGRKIYLWSGTQWEYVIADDVDILWNDIQNKPTSFTPTTHVHNESDISNLDKYTKAEIDDKLVLKSDSTHGHTDLHSHGNKGILDNITQLLIDSWNTVTGKADANHIHDDKYYTETEIDSKLLNKSDTTHNHDGAYYKKSEIDVKLGTKSDTTHGHVDLHTHTNKSILDKVIETDAQISYDLSELKYISDIRNGYTEGHTHSNKTILDSITQLLIDGLNNAVTHISDIVKHITSEERTLWNTVTGKSDVGHTHAYSASGHLHDDRYYTETEMNTALANKSDVGHIHDDKYYTESEIDTKLASKADSTTLSGHTGSTTIHVTQTDKNNWNGKANPVTIGIVKPTNGSMWYKEI